MNAALALMRCIVPAPLVLMVLLILPEPALAINVAAFFYDDSNDEFLTTMRDEFSYQAHLRGINYTYENAAYDPKVQRSQIIAALSSPDKPDFIIINPAEDEIIAEAVILSQRAGVPVVFHNRVGDFPEIASSEISWCLKNYPDSEGRLQAELLNAYEEAFPEVDRNRNGKLDCVILQGEQDSRVAQQRTSGFVEHAEKGRLPLNVLNLEIANWSGLEAYEIMAEIFRKTPPGEVEAVVANNDAMALGAVRALNEYKYNLGTREGRSIPVIGIDATADGLKAIVERRMTGSIEQPLSLIVNAVLDIGLALTRRQPFEFAGPHGLDINEAEHTLYYRERMILREQARHILQIREK